MLKSAAKKSIKTGRKCSTSSRTFQRIRKCCKHACNYLHLRGKPLRRRYARVAPWSFDRTNCFAFPYAIVSYSYWTFSTSTFRVSRRATRAPASAPPPSPIPRGRVAQFVYANTISFRPSAHCADSFAWCSAASAPAYPDRSLSASTQSLPRYVLSMYAYRLDRGIPHKLNSRNSSTNRIPRICSGIRGKSLRGQEWWGRRWLFLLRPLLMHSRLHLGPFLVQSEIHRHCRWVSLRFPDWNE